MTPSHRLFSALEYHDAGLSLLAWGYINGNKKPLHSWKDLQRRRMSRARVQSIFSEEERANIGIITGKLSGLVVIDCDNDEAVDWATNNLPATPWTVQTGRGMQFGYAYPATVVRNIQNAFQLDKDEPGPRIDVRGEGGYVAAPPSIHKSGHVYHFWEEMPVIDRIATLPRYSPNWLPERKTPSLPTAPARPVQQDRAFKRASAWMKKRDPAIQDQGGDTHTFLTAANLLNDFGLNDAQAWDLLVEWNRTCIPPWSDKGLREKFNSAKKNGQAARGSKPDNHGPSEHELIETEVANWATRTGDREEIEDEEVPTFPQNDSGLADQLLYFYGNKMRFCHPWDKWLIWDGSRWRKDDRGMAMHFAKQAAIKNPDPSFVNKSLSGAKLAVAVNLAKHSIHHTVTPEMLDRRPFDLNVYNGTIDLSTGELRKASPGDHNTKLCPVSYDPQATCPRWMQFLSEIFLGDTELVRYMQQAVGYSLTAAQTDHLFFFCYGEGSNGKTTFLKTLLSMTGDYGRQTPHDLLMEKKFNAHPTELAFLQGLRIAIGTEVKEGSGFDEGRLNMLTGSDIVTARFMRGDFFDFLPTHHLWLAGNHKPRVKAATHGIWRRMRLIPFLAKFEGKHIDKSLPDHLLTELPGILAWAVRGALDWKRNGFTTPEIVAQETQRYRSEENLFGTFVADRYTLDPDARVSCKNFRSDYVQWCEDEGPKPLGARAMGARMRAMGFTIIKSSGVRHWKGLRFDP